MNIEDLDPNLLPIMIEVKDGKWDAYTLNNPPTERDKWLLGLIHKAGGISETVEEGRHMFTAVDVGDDVAVTQMTKIPDPEE